MRKLTRLALITASTALVGRLVDAYLRSRDAELTENVMSRTVDQLKADGLLDLEAVRQRQADNAPKTLLEVDLTDLNPTHLVAPVDPAEAERERCKANHPSNQAPSAPVPDISSAAERQGQDWTDYADPTQAEAAEVAEMFLRAPDYEEIDPDDLTSSEVDEIEIPGVPSREEVISQARFLSSVGRATMSEQQVADLMESTHKSALDSYERVIEEIGSEELQQGIVARHGEDVILSFKKFMDGERLDTLEEYLLLVRAIAVEASLQS